MERVLASLHNNGSNNYLYNIQIYPQETQFSLVAVITVIRVCGMFVHNVYRSFCVALTHLPCKHAAACRQKNLCLWGQL